ncbi:MAG: HAD family hydrolase [Candidatus Abawacabacteria bacterium]|nr:HAD family hydrolase [Candidatus Abawacabacteria bacterium]
MRSLLLVDFDGTLCFDRFWRSVSPEVMAQIQSLLFSANRDLIRNWMRGQYSSEQVNRFIADTTGVAYDDLWEMFVRDCENMSVSPKALAQVALLRERFHTVLLTDNMDCFTRFTVPKLQLNAYFDHILNSADHGKMKSDNDGELFAKLAKKIGVSIDQTWLVDNSVSACEHITKQGGRACLVTSEQTCEYWLDSLLLC